MKMIWAVPLFVYVEKERDHPAIGNESRND